MDTAKTTAITAAIVALVIGGVGGYLIGNSMMNDTNSTTTNSETSVAATDTPAADLRVLLNGLQQEHVSLAADATRAGFDGTEDFGPAAGSLDNNSRDLQAAVASVYGDEAGEQFYQIWNSHIGFFVDYTVAAKAGDMAGMNQAVMNLEGYVDGISTFFSEANPNLPKDAVSQLVGQHVTLLKETVDAYGAGDIEGSFAKEREARTQIGDIANAISGAIVKQNPDSF